MTLPPQSPWAQLTWFVALWACGVLALGCVGLLLRWVLG